VVATGDSLWRLAASDLARRTGAPPTAAQTAAAWPAWWAANREVVGDDPDLLRPGAVLRAPGTGTGTAAAPPAGG
jgi:resuscitation-promoting factor RpfA